MSTPSYTYQNPSQPGLQDSNFTRPPLQHHTSYPLPTAQQSNNPYFQPNSPPQPQPYQPVGSHAQHPTFAPNSFPPPPPPSSYPFTPAQTPGASYPQYIPAQHAPPTAYPTGYPTPTPTPYSEYMNPMSPQQYPPEKQGFHQYQEVPIPGPQILSPQGQYLQQQQQQQQQYQYQYQYQPSGYPQQPNTYSY
ncbi:hypothetical protein TWF281_011226 [Arthrobotrys megalospora]